jgi:hypothetical protein
MPSTVIGPWQRLEVAGNAIGVALVEAEFVEIVVGGDVLDAASAFSSTVYLLSMAVRAAALALPAL